nr:hypothetical protein [Tanacetum cinerariifolium]
MLVAEIPCRKVLDDKERKKRRAKEKTVAHAPASNTHAEAQPLGALADEGHVSPPLSAGQMDNLRDHLDEHVSPPPAALVTKLVAGEGRKKGADDNESVLSGLQAKPSPAPPSGRRLKAMEEPAPQVAGPEAKDSYSARCFGNLPFTPQWGLTESSRMDNSRDCRDMMSNFFTPAEEEFFNEGVRDESAIKRSWRVLCQSSQQQENVLLRFEALKQQHSDLEYTHESCKDTYTYEKLSKNYDGALTRKKSLQDMVEELEEEKEKEKREADQWNSLQAERIKQLEEMLKQQRIVNEYLPTSVRRLHQSAKYKRSLGEVFSLAVGKGFIDGSSIGRGDADVRAILEATPNVDPAASNTIMDAYDKLFDRRYPYIEKVSRMYLLDPSNLQNIMSDETRLTHGGGPRDLQRLLMRR